MMNEEPWAGMLADALWRQGIELDTTTIAALERLASRLLEENRKTNLTAIRDYGEVWIRHYLDSLMPLVQNWEIPEGRACDIGSGAGFPGLVFALVRPGKSWTLIESKINKSNWLSSISRELGLSHVTVVRERVESLGHEPEHRERYGLCLARAVAKGTVMLEYSLPLLKVGGELWAWQGEDSDREAWREALRQLGGEWREAIEYVLPGRSASRKKQVVRIVKRCSTPEGFPRRPGIAKKRPL